MDHRCRDDGASEDAARGLLRSASGDVESAVAMFFASEGTVDVGRDETPPWATVAEMTGLSTHDAKELLRSVAGDVQTAVLLHFEGEAALINGLSDAHAAVGKRQRLQEQRDEQLRLVGAVGYDDFVASKYAAPEKRKRKRKKKSGSVFGTLADSSSSSSEHEGSSSDGGSSSEEDRDRRVSDENNDAVITVELHPPREVVGRDGESIYWTCQFTKRNLKVVLRPRIS